MKFRFSKDFVVDSDVEPWRREGLRIAMLGGPGSGKSWNNSLIAEQFLKQGGTVVIFQPRDEYFTLKEKFDVLSVGGVHAKDIDFVLTKPSMYAKAVVHDGISMVFYTSGQDEEKLVNWVSQFIQRLLTYQETQKRPILLTLEEAQEYAPRSASGHVAPPWVYNRMIKAFKDCFTQGRKLNIIAVASSQRPQELNFTIRQLANLTFFGKFSDQDIGYVDKECLKYIRKQGIEVDASRLVTLGLGEWLVIMGKQTRFITVTEPRLTKHGAETPKLEYIAPRTRETKKTVSDLAAAIKEALEKEAAEQSELEKAKRKIRDLEKKLEAAEEKARIKLSVKDMLKGDGDAEELAEKLAKAEQKNAYFKERVAGLVEDHQNLKKKTIETLREKGRLEQKLKQLEPLEDLKEAFVKAFVLLGVPSRSASPGFEPGSKIVHTEAVPEIKHNIERPTVKTNEKTYEGRTLTLVMGSFFDQKRKVSEIQAELEKVFAVQINVTLLRRALPKLVKWKILQREKDSSNTWVYWLVPGAQERIKEAEA
jgi:hypothetical protein